MCVLAACFLVSVPGTLMASALFFSFFFRFVCVFVPGLGVLAFCLPCLLLARQSLALTRFSRSRACHQAATGGSADIGALDILDFVPLDWAEKYNKKMAKAIRSQIKEYAPPPPRVCVLVGV